MMMMLVVLCAVTTAARALSSRERVAAAWSPASWRRLGDAEVPVPAGAAALAARAPLVFAGEVRALRGALARAAGGDGALLAASDGSAAPHGFATDGVRDAVRGLRAAAAALASVPRRRGPRRPLPRVHPRRKQ